MFEFITVSHREGSLADVVAANRNAKKLKSQNCQNVLRTNNQQVNIATMNFN